MTGSLNFETVARAEIDAFLPRLQADEMGIDPDVGTWLAARDEQAGVVGVARLSEIEGARTIDDVWVVPEFRRQGIAAGLIGYAGPPLWLICDEDMIAFYERQGFRLAAAEEFPEPLVALYAARGEWPRASDHAHFAMLQL
jgi:GNAT superfamily N-acetyltransferase